MSSEIAAGPSATRARGVAHGSRGAVVAVGAVFAINGLAIGGWAGVLPALRTRLASTRARWPCSSSWSASPPSAPCRSAAGWPTGSAPGA